MTISAERDAWSVLGFPHWHIFPAGGNVRALGPPRKRHKRFVGGELYSKKAISGWCWSDNRGVRRMWDALPEDALFRCDQEASCYRFTCVEKYDPHVPAAEAASLVKELQAAGFSNREVARRIGLSPDTVSRASQGVGQVRLSTVLLLDELVRTGRNGKNGRNGRVS